jgi:very-short-patch-repair endonuclease
MDDLRALCALHTVFLRREALALGYDDRTLRHACKRGVLHRVRHGSYIFGDTWTSLNEVERHLVVCAAALRTAKSGAVLSHVSAVAAYDLPTWELPLHDVHLTRLDGSAGRSEAGVRQHRGILDPAEVRVAHGLPVTSPARTAVDLTALTDVEHSVPVLSEILRRKWTTKDAFHVIYDSMRRTPGTLKTRIAIGLADERLESVGEARCWCMFYRQGMPMPQPQYEVFDQRGVLVGRVDFAWPELKVFVEFDGKEKYLKYLKEGESVIDAMRREKRREEEICRLTGWRCIRLTWAELYNPAYTCRRIREMFALAA